MVVLRYRSYSIEELRECALARRRNAPTLVQECSRVVGRYSSPTCLIPFALSSTAECYQPVQPPNAPQPGVVEGGTAGSVNRGL